ncbi:MAG: hypothetical protein WBP29_03365, partial [Candidatus Zixiibacteriota bacterium]
SNPFGIDKEVTAYRPVTVAAGAFDAYQVLWKYDLDGTGSYTDQVMVWDEISSSGLLSRRIVFTGMKQVNDKGEVTATLNSTEESWLTRITSRNAAVVTR